MGRHAKATVQPKEEVQVEPVINNNNQEVSSADKVTDLNIVSTQEQVATVQPKEEVQVDQFGGPFESVNKNVLILGENTEGQNMVITSVSVSQDAEIVDLHPNLVKVLIQYPESWDKEKFLKDGDVKLCSQETADQFVNLGIGTIQID